MKIRVMGTANECEAAQAYYLALGKQENVKSVEVSHPYANRNSVNVYRVYINVEYYDDREAGDAMSGRSPDARPRPSGKLNGRRALPSATNAGR